VSDTATGSDGTGDDVVLDLDALDTWIGDRLPGAGQPLTAERIGVGAGIANALFLLERGGHRSVLRRPPLVKNHPSAADTRREWRILQALEGTTVPHPVPLLFCDDPEVLGATFMIMGLIDGFTPGSGVPTWVADDPDALHQLGMAYVDGLVELQTVDWLAGGLEGLGKPEGFLDRQVSRWLGQLDGYRVREIPEEAFLCEWLEANRPEMSPAAIMHGDYSPFNVMVANDRPVRLAAIIDWDTGTIGDPLLDIGHLLARWVEPGEEGPLAARGGDTPTGYPTRREMARRYEEGTGRDLRALPYYEALALFKLGVILEGGHARAVRAGTAENTPTEGAAPRLFEVAAEFARGERV
jgi:aminoglycoside phosphotransferase (APT) family kinase protein